MRCSNCGKDIDESAFPPPLTYCPYCGQNLKASGTEEATGSVHFCPHCGKELPGKVSFCPYCGGEIAKGAAATYIGVEGGEPAERGAKPIIEVAPEQRKKRDKLFRQWIKYANLPPEAVPPKETPADKPVGRGTLVGRAKNLQRIPLLYIVIGLCVIVLFVLITILLVKSC